ncbi:RHS repeat domain-containing protein, partial [Vulcaniibacterium thermophilum]
EAFGADQPNPDPDADGIAFVFDMRFPGQRYDSASGLNYNYFRDYEPATGRYIESDPVGLTASLSTYSYLDGMPVIAIDPLGLGWAARRNYRQRALEDQAHRPDAQPPSSFKQSGPASWFWCARMRCCKDIGAACPSDEFCYDIDFVGGYPSDGAINSGTHDPPGMYCKCTRLQAGPRPAPREPEVLSPEDMLEAIRRMLRSRRR